MHYLVLDTNVYWDMVLDRDRSWSEQQQAGHDQRSPHLFSYLKKLLDNQQIRLVVPAIVVREAELTVDTILSDYNKELKGLEEVCRRMPFLSVFGDDFGTAIGKFVEHLSAWRTILVHPSTKERILAQFRDLLSHPYVISAPLDDNIVQGILRRQIMRRCPFHRGSSPSYGDAAVIETVVGIQRYVQLQPGDEVLLVTRNFKDFSAPGHAEQVHPDLHEDIEYATSEISFTYSRHLFGVLKKRFGVAVPDAIIEEEAQAVEIQEQNQSSSAVRHSNVLLVSDILTRQGDFLKYQDMLFRYNPAFIATLQDLAESSSQVLRLSLAPFADLGKQAADTLGLSMQHLLLGKQVPPQKVDSGEATAPEESDTDEESNDATDPTDSGSQ